MKDNVILRIKTKNKNKLLNKLYKLNIEIYKLNVINPNEITIEIRSVDEEKLKMISIFNDIDIIDYKGKNNIKKNIKFYYIFFIFIIVGLSILILLSNIIFNINIITNNNEIKELVKTSLEKEGIKKYKFKKKYDKIQDITKNIIKENNDKIEWLSIIDKGTKYDVKVIERVVNENITNNSCTNIISKYNAIIKNINTYNGLQLKEVNEYVNKGDVIVSGNIYYNDELRGSVNSDATIYAEVWNKVKVTYDMYNINKKLTGNNKKTISINFINKRIGNEYKTYNKKSKIIFKNNILPINISIDKLYETNSSGIYTESEYILNALEYTNEYINNNLKDNEYIIYTKLLKSEVNSNKIYLEIFYKLYLDIGIESGC